MRSYPRWGRWLERSHSQIISEGFTLIEVLVVVIVIGVLSQIGSSNYHAHLERTYRLQAQTDLYSTAMAFEQFRLATGSYNGAAGEVDDPSDTGIPWIAPSSSPISGGSPKYLIKIEALGQTSDSYILSASRVVSEEGNEDPDNTSLNGKLYYYSSGELAFDRNFDGEITEDERCWKCG